MKHTISVPPDIRLTHWVSSRRASAAAIAAAASGTQRRRTSQCTCPSGAASGTPTTRSTPDDRSFR